MDMRESFFDTVNNQMTVVLATSAGGNVSMRSVSPVCYNGAVLIFTAAGSKKYSQLKANPQCCIQAGGFFAEATAEFCGATLLEKNEALRAAYCAKFPGAFDEGIEFGGRQAEFILLTPKRLSGWAYPDGTLVGEGVPTVPFDAVL